MEIVHSQKLSKIFPDTQVIVALSNALLKKNYRIKIEESKDKEAIYSILDHASVTVSITGDDGMVEDFIDEINPQLECEYPEGFQWAHPELVVKPEEDGYFYLSTIARRGGTLFVTFTDDTSSVLFIATDAKGKEVLIPLSVMSHVGMY
jgi:hypothetical protein